MHRLLRRQLQRAYDGGDPPDDPPFKKLLELVEAAYAQADSEHDLVGRSLQLVSNELLERNRQLTEELATLTEYEQALANSRTELQEVLTAIPDHVWLVDDSGQVLNPRPQITSSLSDSLIEAGGVQAQAKKARIEGRIRLWEFELPSADGVKLYEGRCVPHGTRGCVVLVRDITELRDIQQQLNLSERMASVGVMAAGVAHEVNNPLTFVIANLDHALQSLSDGDAASAMEDALEALREAKAGAERVSHIVRDLRTLANPQPEVRKSCDINQAVDTALTMTANETRHRAQVVRRREDLPLLRAECSRIVQVFVNLLLNAAQAIEPGNAKENRIEIATRCTGSWIEVEICDTGAGIEARDLRKLFDPFFSTKQSAGGLGLGLSICRKIIDEHGGNIRVTSVPGAGTCVIVQLPESLSQPARVLTPEPPRVASAERRQILIIDDEPEVGRAMRRGLAQLHDVTLAQTGMQGLELMGAGDFDLVLCDLMMPEMSGMEVMKRVQAQLPKYTERLVFMTGGAFSEAGIRFLEELNSGHLDKPFDQRELRAFVARQLARLAAAGAGGGEER
ncbi:MAG: response regulator [Polyangiaceae bacterium]|nr:response regulator [Polyangiaceae bacterium]